MGGRKEKQGMTTKKETLEFGWKLNEPYRKVIINRAHDSDDFYLQVFEYEWMEVQGRTEVKRRDLIINAVVESVDILYQD